jgi:hypothetical protein
MTTREETGSLRRRLNQLAHEFDTGINERYELQFISPEELKLSRRLRRATGRLLRRLGLMRPLPPRPPPPLEPWLTELRYIDYGNSAKPLLIWAMDIDRDELRSACGRIRKLQTGSPGWAPVLVTDVADFAFFSRLNWLVEYVPSLSAPADGYFGRKLRYLAWRYRDVPTLSATAELQDDMLLEDLLVD